MVYTSSTPAHSSKKDNPRRLSESGRPQAPPTPEQQEAANRTKTTVRHSLKLGSQEMRRATEEK